MSGCPSPCDRRCATSGIVSNSSARHPRALARRSAELSWLGSHAASAAMAGPEQAARRRHTRRKHERRQDAHRGAPAGAHGRLDAIQRWYLLFGAVALLFLIACANGRKSPAGARRSGPDARNCSLRAALGAGSLASIISDSSSSKVCCWGWGSAGWRWAARGRVLGHQRLDSETRAGEPSAARRKWRGRSRRARVRRARIVAASLAFGLVPRVACGTSRCARSDGGRWFPGAGVRRRVRTPSHRPRHREIGPRRPPGQSAVACCSEELHGALAVSLSGLPDIRPADRSSQFAVFRRRAESSAGIW